MNKLQNIVNKKWFPFVFFLLAICVSVFQHYRVFSLDVIGYHSWRQTQTQTVIDNFATVDLNILNPRVNDLHYPDGIFRMEFPLAQWLIALLYKLFGNHLVITRLFFYGITIVSMIGIYRLILELTKNKLTGLLTACFFLASPIIYYYSVNPLPDNLALCFSIWAIYFWIKYLNSKRTFLFIFSAILLALSIAVKLPFIVLGGMYLSEFYDRNAEKKINFKYILIPFLVFIPVLVWYISVIPNWDGNGVVKGIFDNTEPVSQLLLIVVFNLFSTLPELLVNYATVPLFLTGLYYLWKQFSLKNAIHRSFFYAGALLILYFLYEMPLIGLVHDYYLFPFIPLVFVIVAKGINSLLNNNSRLNYLILVCLIVSPITAYLRCNTRWNTYTPGFSYEYLMYKQKLQNIIPDTAKVIVVGDDSRSIVLYHLQRKGWSYADYGIKDGDFEVGINNGATFVITDSDMSGSKPFNDHVGELVFKRNRVKLYKVK